MEHCTLLLGILALTICAAPCRADDGAVTAIGGSVRPLAEHPTVRLDAEYVHIQFVRNDAWVECVFFLDNTGPATSVTLGFPNFSGGADVNAVRPFSSFASYVDGDSVPVTIVPDADHHEYGDYRAWYVKDVSFEAGQRRTVRDVYTGTEGGDSSGYLAFEYVLWSGGTWAGPIGAADIVVTWDPREAPIDSVDIQPTGYHISGNEIRWHFVNLNPGKGGPEDEISLRWKPHRAQ